ncbi:4Fe-4S ferredoxin N-terminal domain-containing protein [Natronobacterium gregoryi]|uniref:4Fe-4S ferredoxin iron-sulfur binding domain-containing protein n=2 Tax=Natronobacterium gregoryi TaxID=44930 RepID=L0AIH0_NATGS|nr:4Fe-4S ferredoxin N-terminal domain-containing protein [Natronobacterium gregoryi]AFZ73678.1 hypothetical protein Natgr_2517 [Natronobacterium gregoryi SP2]ELY67870.1 hypothetical protein C490_10700 [Natronobacterium gregoryi SP2]PLK19597.1 hypothetical protein CYV19_13790 [Natronobacterium gregoryi SP2]SFJ00866.1 prokaryotic molybdopterin-containing oxidoreductase family, iron-sulfur binding subunit [Natronobacterium gregoryi]
MDDESDEESTGEDVDGIDPAIWEETADEILDSGPYDAELGKRMSRDAVRVTLGHLSEEEFYEKYHDDVIAEFGIDERPIEEDDTHE